MIDKQILNYKIFRKIGRGNLVTLYKAHDIEDTDKNVLIQIYDDYLAKDPQIVEKFRTFAEQFVDFDHPNFVKQIDFEINPEYLITITEYLSGQNLKFAVLIKGLSLDEDISIFKQTLEAINYLHSKNIVHRDIKPENIFLTKNYSKVKLLDTAITGVFEYDHPSKISKRIDTPMFLSPEQASGQSNIGKLSDIYSLGVLLYFIHKRKLPFENTNSYTEILQQIIEKPIPELTFEKNINNIIQKATQKKPQDRYQNCQEIIEDLKSV